MFQNAINGVIATVGASHKIKAGSNDKLVTRKAVKLAIVAPSIKLK